MCLLVSTTSGQDPTFAPAGSKTLLTLTGIGVQIYTCKNQTTEPAWSFVGPQAKLFDHETDVGSHGVGPTWTLKDGSWVKGQLIATKQSPDANAIPWLLLKASEANGPGALAEVKYIRRSDTVGGKARTTGCDVKHFGVVDEIPYKAVYTFYDAAQ
jgi:hypothetical protein